VRPPASNSSFKLKGNAWNPRDGKQQEAPSAKESSVWFTEKI